MKIVNNDFGNIKIKYFIGIDVSKHTLDFAVIEHQQPILTATIANEPSAIKALLKTYKALPAYTKKKALYCWESTGIYGNHLLQCLQQAKAMIVVENPLHIKLSMGLVRDKTDQKRCPPDCLVRQTASTRTPGLAGTAFGNYSLAAIVDGARPPGHGR